MTARRSNLALLKCAGARWISDEAGTIGAALAFYCAFSLGPLLIILVTLAGWIAGEQVAYGHLSEQLTALFGKPTAEVLLQAMHGSQSDGGVIAAIISIVSLIIGATTVFAALESALERIWGAQALVPTGWRGWVRSRLLSFGLILAVGFLLLISLTLATALAALRGAIAARFTGLVAVAGLIDLLISVALVTGLIALIYRYMPARRLPWRPILQGALITALLFYAGRWLISLYLGRSTQASAFGAAASFAALLLWLYYSAQIFLFGAEYTACLGGLRDESGADKKAAAAALASG
jgi:membrane protein